MNVILMLISILAISADFGMKVTFVGFVEWLIWEALWILVFFYNVVRVEEKHELKRDQYKD